MARTDQHHRMQGGNFMRYGNFRLVEGGAGKMKHFEGQILIMTPDKSLKTPARLDMILTDGEVKKAIKRYKDKHK